MVPVTLEQFPLHATWVWAYSAFDVQKQVWKAPYLYEQYTVVAVEGSIVTMEMASGSEFPVIHQAHHKFVADVSKCLVAYGDYKTKKPWTVVFYTKSFGPQWELVSSAHKPLVFTEKFNCITTIDDGINLPSQYEEAGPLAGVASFKLFDVNYKFELLTD